MKLVWFRRAIADLSQIRAFIARQNPQAARAVADRIMEATTTLRKLPGMGRPGRVEGTRELVIQGTPFVIPYRIKGDTVQILRVLHGAQRYPG